MVFGRRYRVTEKIGSGGMAEVYKAVDEVLGRTVAIKVLHPQYASDANFVARFRQEAQAAANLSHPTIVNIYDWGQDDSTYYIIMEWVRGTDLKSLVQQRGKLDPMKAAEYAAQVCSALATAHGYDIIHRDIKPHNIVLTPDGQIKVMDFGIARAGNTTMTQTGSVLGTAQYISPEQAQGRSLTPASDLYSLGVVLYELTTGRLPFEGDTPVAVALKQVNEQPRPPRQMNPALPASLEAVIMRAMAKNPAERYASAAEMREDLKRVIAGQAPAAAPLMASTSVMPAVEREEHEAVYGSRRAVAPKKRSPWPWIAFIAALLLLAGLGWWYTQANRPVTVPDLRGKTQAEAETLLAENGLVLGGVDTKRDETVPEGQVVDQSPPPGTPVDEGAEVRLVISSGVPEVAIPEGIIGMSEAEAVAALEEAGLQVAAPSIREFSSEFEEDQVIRSEPEPGDNVPKGTRVRLYVSKGQQAVTIPNVVGKRSRDARSQLQELGLKVTVTEEFSDDVPQGRVIRQDPGQGTLLAPGNPVALVVSRGPNLTTVPNVIGRTEADARAELDALGFTVNVGYEPVEDPAEVGVVLDQTPKATKRAKRGDTVTISVGQQLTP